MSTWAPVARAASAIATARVRTWPQLRAGREVVSCEPRFSDTATENLRGRVDDCDLSGHLVALHIGAGAAAAATVSLARAYTQVPRARRVWVWNGDSRGYEAVFLGRGMKGLRMRRDKWRMETKRRSATFTAAF